jgi:NAD(P)H-dependent FMN reductase
VTHQILLLCGSLRAGSTNEALLRTAAAVLPAGATGLPYLGMAELPHFNPDDDRDPLHPAVTDLRARIAAADALLICTPEYAGGLPGSFKNLLDWTVGGVEIGGKPTAWINASSRGPEGAAGAHACLRAVLDYTDAAIVDDACAWIPVPHQSVGDDGLIHDEASRADLATVLNVLIAHIDKAR